MKIQHVRPFFTGLLCWVLAAGVVLLSLVQGASLRHLIGAAILAALGSGTRSADELVELTQIPARRVLSALTLLQIRQLVEEEGRRFSTPVELQEES